MQDIVCRTWQSEIGGSGEHSSLCKGAHDVKGYSTPCCKIILSIGLEFAKHYLCCNIEEAIIIYCWADFLGVAPPFVLAYC